MEWIWNELSIIYHHKHKGKEFLSIAETKFKPGTDTPLSYYNSYRAKILENLLPAGTTVKFRKNQKIQNTEVISPTFENHILLTVLMLIDTRLPEKVKAMFGPRFEEDSLLMDFKSDILAAVPKILEDLEAEEGSLNAVNYSEETPVQVAYMSASKSNFNYRNRGRGRGRGNTRQGSYNSG